MPITLRQRSKIIPLFGFLAIVLFIRLPWWFIYYSWRSNRPRRSWTLHRTIRAQLLRQIASLPTTYGLSDGRDLSLEVPQEELEPLSARFVWIPELKEDLVGALGEHAASAGVKSIAIPAYWILKEGSRWSPEHEKPLKDEKVMVYFHGGAFVLGTAYPTHPTAALPKGLLKYSRSLSRVLSVDYRLSSGPPFEYANPFPCAVIDGISAYKYLVREMGFLPQNITIGGDSAGGNIALAVTRYIVESRLPHLPPPGRLIPASPAADLSFSRAGPNTSHYLNAASDMFDLTPTAESISPDKPHRRAYLGGMNPEESRYNRYISPASRFAIPPDVDGDTKLFSGFPRSYVIGGGAEHMFDDIVALAEKMKEDGVDVTTDFPPDALHCYFVFSWQEPERTESFVKCADWLDAATVAVELADESENILS
ncbi:alpha/beta-hydrolase [Thelephora terrestris]|uniref:Alpha/beta-hydrolase n=1 Tax=Thelephora terrestris TaxID=56493 RepID=A0A9P6HLW2_9AGAM|nr:alpha/beta-hydrolase [Thelephora terrestris]